MICCECEIPKLLWYFLDNKNYAMCCICNQPVIPTPPILTRYKKLNESTTLQKNKEKICEEVSPDSYYC